MAYGKRTVTLDALERTAPVETVVPPSLEFLQANDPVRRFFDQATEIDQLYLREFNQTRTTYLKLGRTPEQATDETVTGRVRTLNAEIKDLDELAWQIRQVDDFAACYRHPRSTA